MRWAHRMGRLMLEHSLTEPSSPNSLHCQLYVFCYSTAAHQTNPHCECEISRRTHEIPAECVCSRDDSQSGTERWLFCQAQLASSVCAIRADWVQLRMRCINRAFSIWLAPRGECEKRSVYEWRRRLRVDQMENRKRWMRWRMWAPATSGRNENSSKTNRAAHQVIEARAQQPNSNK